MATRKAPLTTATSPETAIIRCSCSISLAIWNAAHCVQAMSIRPTVGRTCWSRSWPGIGASSSAATSEPMPPLQILRSTSSRRPNTTSTRSGCLPIRFYNRGSATCSSARSVALPSRFGGTTPTSAIRRKAGRYHAASWRRSSGTPASFIRASASSSPTCRARPSGSLPSTTSAGRASNGSRKATARSSGRGCHAGRSLLTPSGFSFMRSPTISAISCGRSQHRSRSRSHGEVDSDRRSGRVRLGPPTLETTMQTVADRPEAPNAIRTDLGAIFISLELSRSTWLITSLSPDGGEKMSKHAVRGGDVAGLLERFAQLRKKARARTGKVFPFVVIQEAGLDGFWIDRVLRKEGIESHVVDPASITTSRRRRRAKTDRIDGEALVRALLAYKRGEPRVCAMVKAPTPEEEDRRRLCRERKVLIVERVRHVNRVKGLLFSQGISGYEPLRRDRRERLDTLQTGDGRRLPDHLKAQVRRELDRLELLLEQIKAVEAERDVLLAAQRVAAPAAMLLDIKGIGPEFAAILWSEGLFRHFDNRRQVASYAGLAPTPWQSGSIDREQGVSKAGNPRLRTTLIQLAWLWLRNQPQSALALWFKERVNRNGGRLKKTTIVALARKLLVALWKYVTAGVVIEGAIMKSA